MPIFATDRALLDRYRRGDRDALSKVYRHYVNVVETLVRRGFSIESAFIRGLDREAAVDIVQETFIKAFGERARLAFDGVQPFQPYLLRIAKNLMIDRYRRRAPSVVAVEDLGEVAPEDLAWQQQLASTKDFIASLSAEEQRIVALRFDEERSQEDVADMVGCTRRRVRTVERDVQTALRKWLVARGFIDMTDPKGG